MEYYFVFLTLLFGSIYQSECKPWIPAPVETPHWFFAHQHLAYVANSQSENIKVAFYGDSLTQGWDMGIWEKEFCPYGSYNFGIGGDQVQNILFRLVGEMLPMDPDIMVLMIGGNNLLVGVDANEEIAFGIFTILQAMAEHKPRTKVLLLGIIPSNMGPEFWDRSLAINDDLKFMANNQTIFYLGMWDEFLDGSPGYGYVDPDIYPDGIHLSKRGYEIYADAIRPTFQAIWDLVQNDKQQKQDKQ